MFLVSLYFFAYSCKCNLFYCLIIFLCLYCIVLCFVISYQNWVMASLWHNFVEAVTPGHSQSGQGGGGHHNCMVGEHPLSCKPAESCQGGMFQVQL